MSDFRAKQSPKSYSTPSGLATLFPQVHCVIHIEALRAS